MVKMSSEHQVMDSSLSSLGRLSQQDGGLCGAGLEKKLQVGLEKHLNGCVPLSHQVAGHKFGVDKVGILQHPDGTVLKQLQPPPRGPREMHFYKKVYTADSGDPSLLNLQHYLPKYYGTWSSPDAPTDLYLKLEDVTRKFSKPCIMDVKIGQRSYDPFASQEKREQQIKKYPLMEEIGFLVLGMRVYQVNSDTYDTYDQHYGRGLVKETIREGVAKFFDNGESLRKDAVVASMQKVQKILQWFEGQSQLHFYASSLLFVYEGFPRHGAPQPPGDVPPGGTTMMMTMATAGGDAGDLKERVLECNNNMCQVGLRENGHLAAALGQSLSNMYALHSRGCPLEHHVEDPQWKCPARAALEQSNGNGAKTQQDTADGTRGSVDVEVRMIDFAHVFPSNTRDEGYIYGLKNLLSVLQQIVDHS
uniref:Kinase n=1 Tax=Scleropages formosus TaxID=113540 RepID=A0A8C9SZ05_SCLFO